MRVTSAADASVVDRYDSSGPPPPARSAFRRLRDAVRGKTPAPVRSGALDARTDRRLAEMRAAYATAMEAPVRASFAADCVAVASTARAEVSNGLDARTMRRLAEMRRHHATVVEADVRRPPTPPKARNVFSQSREPGSTDGTSFHAHAPERSAAGPSASSFGDLPERFRRLSVRTRPAYVPPVRLAERSLPPPQPAWHEATFLRADANDLPARLRIARRIGRIESDVAPWRAALADYERDPACAERLHRHALAAVERDAYTYLLYRLYERKRRGESLDIPEPAAVAEPGAIRRAGRRLLGAFAPRDEADGAALTRGIDALLAGKPVPDLPLLREMAPRLRDFRNAVAGELTAERLPYPAAIEKELTYFTGRLNARYGETRDFLHAVERPNGSRSRKAIERFTATAVADARDVLATHEKLRARDAELARAGEGGWRVRPVQRHVVEQFLGLGV